MSDRCPLVYLFGYSVLVHLSICQPVYQGWKIFTCRSVNLSTRVDKTRDKYMRSRHYGYSVLVYLSTCLPGLRGAEVNIGEQWLMGIPYLSTWRPANLSTRVDRPRGKYRRARDYGYSVLVHLSTRVDRSRGKYRRARDYGYPILVHLSTCLSGLTGPEVNIGEQGIMGIPYLSTCQPVYQG